MRKLAVTLTLIASFALAASSAEAAKTSEREGRKFSRKYVKQFSGRDFPALGWKIRDCYRIGNDGAGNYRLFPRGVLCLYSSTKDTGRVPCWVLGIGVKDGRRDFQASHVGSIQPWRGDPAYCDHGPGALELPPPPFWGATGGALRPVTLRRPPCVKRVDGIVRMIGGSGRTGRLNISCRKAKRIMTRYILHKKLPGQWYCDNLGAAFGKCVDEKELYSEECAGREQRCVSSFSYSPGSRA